MRATTISTFIFAFCLVAFAGTAEATPGAYAGGEPASDGAVQLRPSLLYSYGGGDDRSHGFGLGLESLHFPGTSGFNLGAFAQGQRELDDAWRVAGGFRAGYSAFGLQLGVAHRTETDRFTGSTGIQLAKTFHWGPLGVAARWTFPVKNYQPDQGPAMATQGVEFAVVMSLGWSFDVQGNRPFFSGCHGGGDQRSRWTHGGHHGKGGHGKHHGKGGHGGWGHGQ